MAWPFFQLVPSSSDSHKDDNIAYQASLTPAELSAFEVEAEALYMALYEALDAYCAAHEPTQMAVCLDAARCLVYALEREIAEDAADA